MYNEHLVWDVITSIAKFTITSPEGRQFPHEAQTTSCSWKSAQCRVMPPVPKGH